MALSKTLQERINARLAPDPVVEEVSALFDTALSFKRFDSQEELQSHLSEGAMLSINTIGSRALSVPCGDYVVWTTDAGHTMLVPAAAPRGPQDDVFENVSLDKYDVMTDRLLSNWNKVERVLAEEAQPPQFSEKHEENLENLNNQEDDGEDDEGAISSHIDAATVDRLPILRAMQDRGFTVTSLAAEVGVDPPAISRIMREPQDTQGDPGGRNPSIGLAAQVCNALRIDPTSAFPDIFGTQPKYQARDTPGNKGSGMSNAAAGSTKHGAASQKWTQGNTTAESVLDELCTIIAEESVPFGMVWRSVIVPTMLEGGFRTPKGVLAECTKVICELTGRDAAASQRYAERLQQRRESGSMPGETPLYQQRQQYRATAAKNSQAKDAAALSAHKNRMQDQVVQPVKTEFATAMHNFKNRLQQKAQQTPDKRVSGHLSKLTDQMYGLLMQSGAKVLSTIKHKATIKPTEIRDFS